MAKHIVKAWLLFGFPISGACNSLVSFRDSLPVTYSVPVSGNKSPHSVASTKKGAVKTTLSPVCVLTASTAFTQSPSTSALVILCSVRIFNPNSNKETTFRLEQQPQCEVHDKDEKRSHLPG